jgi:hypothetical protein
LLGEGEASVDGDDDSSFAGRMLGISTGFEVPKDEGTSVAFGVVDGTVVGLS